MVEALQDNAMTALVDGMNAVHTAIRNNAPSGWTVEGNGSPVTCCFEQCGLSTRTGLVDSCAIGTYAYNVRGCTLCCNLCNWTITRVSGTNTCIDLCMDSACFMNRNNVCRLVGCLSQTSFCTGSYMCLTDGSCISIRWCCACCVLCNVIRCYSCIVTDYNPYEYNNNCPSCTYCANQCCDIDFTQMRNAILLNAGLNSLGRGTVCRTYTSGTCNSSIPAPTVTGDYTDCVMEKITLSGGCACICYEGETAFYVGCSPIYLKYCSLPLHVSRCNLTREII